MSKYTGSAKFIEDQLSIIGKDMVERPFILNNIQARFVQQATGRDVILKARQMGFSSFILAAFTKDFILKDNSLSVILADKTDNSQDLLARVKHYIKSYEEKNNVKVPLKYNSKYELQNAHNNARYII
jgi:nucleotidyltransferase/DNA polymerase involved in DNA repair